MVAQVLGPPSCSPGGAVPAHKPLPQPCWASAASVGWMVVGLRSTNAQRKGGVQGRDDRRGGATQYNFQFLSSLPGTS